MTIPAVRLDDLTWAEMVARVRDRVIAESDGQWTLHAPVDPGITLLELYAYLLEQRLYLMDQVPDALVRGVLRLLGVPGPRPAVAATTVIAFSQPADAAPAVVPAGARLERWLENRNLTLTLDDPVAVVPGARPRLVIGGTDCTADLSGPAGLVEVLGSGGGPAEFEIELDVPAGFEPPSTLIVSLLVELDAPDRLRPAWAPDAPEPSDVPPPTVLQWWYDGTAGLEPFPSVGDTTGGLRRSGIVRLPVPAAWRGAGAPTTRRIVVRTDAATFSSPPRLRALTLNVGVARQRERREPTGDDLDAVDLQLESWLRLPGQVLRLASADELLDGPVPDDVELHLVERDGAEHAWHATDDLTVWGPESRVFLVDRQDGVLRFGDGLNGRVPVPATRATVGGPRLRVAYSVGGGSGGNLGTGQDWLWTPGVANGVSARNVPEVAFGADPETIEDARTRAGGELRRPSRLVTEDDHSRLILDTPGVALARVHVAVGRHPAAPCDLVPAAVTLVVVPEVPRDEGTRTTRVAAPQPDPGALAVVRERVEQTRLLAAEVFVEGPVYRRVELVVEVAGRAALAAMRARAGLRQVLTEGMARYLDPLEGGPDGTGWPFGGPLRPSELLGRAQSLAGTRATVVAVAISIDGDGRLERCSDVVIRPHELVVLERLDVTVRTGVIGEEGLQ